MDDTLKRLRLIVEDKAAEMGWKPDDVLALAASTFARGNPIIDEDRLKPFLAYQAMTGTLADHLIGEAIDQFAECNLVTLVEELTEHTKRA
jgi:hypothetical protein